MRSHFFLILFVLVFFINAEEDNDIKQYSLFKKFMSDHAKNYTNIKDMESRFGNFKNNLKIVQELNKEFYREEGDSINIYSEFMDLTTEEFQNKYLLKNITDEDIHTQLDDDKDPFEEENSGRFLSTTEVPSSWDWRTQGAVTRVKTQGNCGACWAYATVGHIEGLYYVKNKSLKTFSVQQFIDCDETNGGCTSGIAGIALRYLMRTEGLQLAEDYPRTRFQKECEYRPELAVARIKRTFRLPSWNENYIKRMLYNHGPLPIAINGSKFMYYTGGIISYDECNPTNLNHAVLLVGYGTSPSGIDYWIMKNTWGPSWGESGYFRIIRGKGMCGLNRYIVGAVLA